MASVLLTTLNAKYIHLNLAIRILYDLNKDNCDLHWKEFTIKENTDTIASHCAAFDVVCFSCYIWNIVPTLAVCKAIKANNPNCKILLGGPEVSYEWEDVIAHDCVDYIIAGEGEIPFEHFVKNYPDVSNVPNLIYKINGGVHYNKQNVQFDVALLANRNPYQYDNTEELKNKVCYIETSRGCPYKCEFCLASLDNKVRYLPIDTIKNNLHYLMQHGKTIKFLDRTFNVKRDFTIDMFEFILEHHRAENVFQFEITADIVHPDIIAFINEKVPKGLFRFEIGIQTVNKDSNLAVSRKQNFDKTAGVIKQLHDKIEMHLDLIVGLPLDYWEDTKYSFEQVFALHPPELQLGFLKFLKGTPVREKYEQHNYVFDAMPPYQIKESKFLSADELHSITLLENALEIYWNKKRAVRSLKYVASKYSIFDFLVGLGTAFEALFANKQYGLKDIYEVYKQFIKENYSQDAVLLQLASIDYFSNFNIKPADIFDTALDKSSAIPLLEAFGYNTQKCRHYVLHVDFNWQKFESNTEIQYADNTVVIEYTGTTKPTLESITLVNEPV